MTSKTYPRPGIFSVDEAAGQLSAEPIEVQRLIALGELPDNRDTKGSVVYKSDLESFWGRAPERLKTFRVSHDWFANDPSLTDSREFGRRIRRLAGDVPNVSDEALQAAYERNPRQKSFSFEVDAPPSMQVLFCNDATGGMIFRSDCGIPLGVSAMAAALRTGALDIIRKKFSTGTFGKRRTAIGTLYESPATFNAVVNEAKERLPSLAPKFIEQRTPDGESGLRSVTTQIKFSSLSTNIQRHIAMAVELAF